MERVLLLTTFYPPYSVGGDAVDMQSCAQALARRGCQVTVVHDEDALRAIGARPHGVSRPHPGVEVVGLRSGLGRLGLLLAHQTGRPVVHGRRLRRLCGERRFDTVIFGNVSLVGGPGVFDLCPEAVRAYIATEHWLICPTHVLWRYDGRPCDERRCLRCTLHHRRPPQLWRHAGVLARAARHIDVFIARSEFSRGRHREYGFTAPMEVVPPFVASPPAAPAAAAPHPRPYFLFVGRIELLKGLADLLPLFHQDRGVDLVVAGTGTAEGRLREASAGTPHVRWLGFVPREDLSVWLHHALALVVPSTTYETFGIVAIEALSHGTPVVARRRGPLPEIVARGGGVLFDSASDLDGALRMLAADQARRLALADEARQAFRAHWSEEAVMPRFIDCIARARARRSGTAGDGRQRESA